METKILRRTATESKKVKKIVRELNKLTHLQLQSISTRNLSWQTGIMGTDVTLTKEITFHFSQNQNLMIHFLSDDITMVRNMPEGSGKNTIHFTNSGFRILASDDNIKIITNKTVFILAFDESYSDLGLISVRDYDPMYLLYDELKKYIKYEIEKIVFKPIYFQKSLPKQCFTTLGAKIIIKKEEQKHIAFELFPHFFQRDFVKEYDYEVYRDEDISSILLDTPSMFQLKKENNGFLSINTEEFKLSFYYGLDCGADQILFKLSYM